MAMPSAATADSATVLATATQRRHTSAGGRAPPLAVHVAAAVWIAGMLVLGSSAAATYERLLQEDRFVEWLTVTLFAAAGVYALRRAVGMRRVFDGLVGAFCVFVAGEEFSWGQRLLGLTPPAPFLEHNKQQELTVHNFAEIFGQPKWVLVLALLGFGLVLPVIARALRGRAALERIGATPPHPALAVWLLAAAALLVWYPLTLTGEWVEALAGGLFLTAFAVRPRMLALSAGAAAAAALALAFVSGTGRAASGAAVACARAETDALVRDLAYGTAATGRLAGAARVHKRLYTAVTDGYVLTDQLTGFLAADCEGEAGSAERRLHGIDPWGTAYWLRTERQAVVIRLAVYSFGPNRRRDPEQGSDDIVAELEIRP